MSKTFRTMAVECVFDLGITVVYAVIAGLAIVAVVASDDGPVSLAKAALYASLLPASVVLMILVDLALRVRADARETRRRSGLSMAR